MRFFLKTHIEIATIILYVKQEKKSGKKSIPFQPLVLQFNNSFRSCHFYFGGYFAKVNANILYTYLTPTTESERHILLSADRNTLNQTTP